MSKNEILTEAVETAAEETLKEVNIVNDYLKPIAKDILMALGAIKTVEIISKPAAKLWNKVSSKFPKKNSETVVEAEVKPVENTK